jgi:hypothetical protein
MEIDKAFAIHNLKIVKKLETFLIRLGYSYLAPFWWKTDDQIESNLFKSKFEILTLFYNMDLL